MFVIFLDGYVVIFCREPVTNRAQGQLMVDYLTDAIISVKLGLNGIPNISPDSRNLATIYHTNDGSVVIVQKITRKVNFSINLILKIYIFGFLSFS